VSVRVVLLLHEVKPQVACCFVCIFPLVFSLTACCSLALTSMPFALFTLAHGLAFGGWGETERFVV
jgi:hypothetical protein